MANEMMQYTPPQLIPNERREELYGLPAQLIYDIVSGKLAQQGYTLNEDIRNTLMSYGPALGKALERGGFEGYDPRWVQQYVKPGKLGADDWMNMMDYIRSFHGAAGAESDWEASVLPMMEEYQMGGYYNPWKGWMLEEQQRAFDRLLGQQFNPFTGQYEPIPQMAQQGFGHTLSSLIDTFFTRLDDWAESWGLTRRTETPSGGTGGGAK